MCRSLVVLPLLPLLSVLAMLAGCGGSSAGDETSRTAVDGRRVVPTRPLQGRVADPSPLGPWPGFAHDPRHGGAATVVGPQHLKVRWQRRLEGAVVPGPAVGRGGVVYAASNGGVLHAIDLRSGRDRWSFDGGAGYGSDLSTVPALTAEGTVLWPGPESTLFALSPEGRLLWSEQLPAQPLSPVVLEDGGIVVGDTSGTLEELTPGEGGAPTVSWRVDLGSASYGSPAVGPDDVVYTTADESLFAVRGGEVLWHFSGVSISEVSAAVAPDGTIVFGSNDSEYGVTPAGEEKWRHRNGSRTYSSPIVTDDGLAYFGDNRGFLTILDAGSGELVARLGGEDPAGVWTAPAVDARHDVYFGTSGGVIQAFDGEGERLFEFDVGATVDSYPALAGDGTLLIGSENGILYALD